MDCVVCNTPIPHWDEEYDENARKYQQCRKCMYAGIYKGAS